MSENGIVIDRELADEAYGPIYIAILDRIQRVQQMYNEGLITADELILKTLVDVQDLVRGL